MPRGWTARGLTATVLLVVGLTALWWGRTDDDGPSATRTEPAMDLPVVNGATAGAGAVPSGRAEEVRPDPPAADIERFCGLDGGGDPASRCRITARLVRPPRLADDLRLIEGRHPSDLGRPAIPDAADPHVLVDGQTYFVFSTSAEVLNVPVAVIPDRHLVPHPDGTPGFGVDPSSGLVGFFGRIQRYDALPERPAWARDTGIWAPSVARFGSRYVMFFAAKRPNPPDPANQECVGRAVADRPDGPFVADPDPFTCGLRGVHGALDPSVFRAPDGSVHLHVAFGGTSTTLWTIPLNDWADPIGPPRPLLRMQQPWEYWFLENPSMIHDGRHYLLAYSAGDWRFASYSTGLARCRTPAGPCRSNRSGTWLAASGAVSGPGGLSFFRDVRGRLMVAFHGYPAGGEALFGARSTFIRAATLRDGRLSLE